MPGLREVYKAVLVRRQITLNLQRRPTQSHSTPWICGLPQKSLDASIAYISEVFDDYFRNAGLRPDAVNGKKILELGPGCNLGVAIRFLLAGADRVVCADRFPSLDSTADQLRIYRRIRENLDPDGKCAFDQIMTLGRHSFALNPARLEYLTDAPIERLGDVLNDERFGIILSRAVLEHVLEPKSALRMMEKLLEPGGMLLHEVDFRDHGIFSHRGLHPLTFLTIPDPEWNEMGSNIGAPNRHLIDFWKTELSTLGFASEFLVKHLVSSDSLIGKRELRLGHEFGPEEIAMIKKIRPRLTPRFQQLETEDLLVSVAFFSAKKPGISD